MIVSPYSTLACKAYNLGSIEKAIKLAFIEEGLTDAKLNGKVVEGVMLISPDNKEVPPFGHPLIHEASGVKWVILDARGFIRKDRDHGFAVTNTMEYEFLVLRGALTRYALEAGGADLGNCGDIAMVSFARFVSENIVRRLGLSPEEQALITMVSAFYYLCLFRDSVELEESDINKMAQKISRVTHIPAQWIFDRAEKLRYMANVDDFILVLKAVVENTRIENLNRGLLFGMLGGAWFGSNRTEIMPVALEHPPTFIAMVYTALKDRSFRKSGLGTVVLANDKGGLGQQFIRNVVALIGVTHV